MSGNRKLSEGELVWHGEYPPEIVERVRAEIASDLDGVLDEASDLCFHTMILDDEIQTSRIVTIWGVEGDSRLHCEFSAKANWQPLSVEDED